MHYLCIEFLFLYTIMIFNYDEFMIGLQLHGLLQPGKPQVKITIYVALYFSYKKTRKS